MKHLVKIIILISMVNQGCENSQKIKEGPNQFSSLTDTLIIQTEKQRGGGLFHLGAGYLQFPEGSIEFPYSVVFPENIDDIKRTQLKVDPQEEIHHYVDIMKGSKNGEMIFIVDENNNKDFTDDSVRIPQSMKWFSLENLVMIKFFVLNKETRVEDSSWAKIGLDGEQLLYGRNEYLSAKFSIDKKRFQVGVIDQMNAKGFTYEINPEIALLKDNAVVKDTLLEKDLLILGEYLNLGGDYYKFESISRDGKQLTLVKDDHFEEQVGTQVGMIAPEFKGVTINGDTIDSANLHDKMIVIANSCGCGGDEESTDAYFQIKKEYGNKIYTLHLDRNIEKGLFDRKMNLEKRSNMHIDMKDEFNKDLNATYRKFFCSRTSYVIDENRRILDKFEVTDWQSFLPLYIQQ